MRLKKKQNDMLRKIVTLSIKNPHVKANIMGAIKRNNIDGWKDTTQRKQSN